MWTFSVWEISKEAAMVKCMYRKGRCDMMNQIILFDGECNVCNKSVQFIIKRDPKAIFTFASQQSTTGKKMMEQYGIDSNLNSLVLVDQQTYFIKSSAALKICRKLRWPWSLFSLFLFIPTPIRDSLYHFVAKNRYRFGRNESCMLLPSDERKRFLD
jgi:predicted DCC family thiol-disulfide oxidoreductase YuxK